MILNEHTEFRKNPRSAVHGAVEVEVSCAGLQRGGQLRDMSVCGASVIYPEGMVPEDDPIQISEEILLVIRGRAYVPGRVVRVFDNGFAVEFDWSIDVDRDRFDAYA